MFLYQEKHFLSSEILRGLKSLSFTAYYPQTKEVRERNVLSIAHNVQNDMLRTDYL